MNTTQNKIELPLGWSLQQIAGELAAEQNGRLKFRDAKPSTAEIDRVRIDTKNCGRYSSRCRYTRYEHTPLVTSYVVITDDGAGISGRIQSTDYSFTAPRGYSFTTDSLGVMLRGQGGDRHITASDIHRGETPTLWAKQIRAQIESRRAARVQEKRDARDAKVRAREIGSCRVTLADSRNAGNCAEGTLRWVERCLNIPRAEVIDAGHLFSVPASRVLFKGCDPRAVDAANAAWNRETAVSI